MQTEDRNLDTNNIDFFNANFKAVELRAKEEESLARVYKASKCWNTDLNSSLPDPMDHVLAAIKLFFLRVYADNSEEQNEEVVEWNEKTGAKRYRGIEKQESNSNPGNKCILNH